MKTDRHQNEIKKSFDNANKAFNTLDISFILFLGLQSVLLVITSFLYYYSITISLVVPVIITGISTSLIFLGIACYQKRQSDFGFYQAVLELQIGSRVHEVQENPEGKWKKYLFGTNNYWKRLLRDSVMRKLSITMAFDLFWLCLALFIIFH